MAHDLEPDLLTAPADRLVSLQYVLAALRRKRRLLAVLALVGLCLGGAASIAVPKSRTATTVLLLQFPDGADPSRAINTDVSLLHTRGRRGGAEVAPARHAGDEVPVVVPELDPQ